MQPAPCFEDVAVGTEIPPISKGPMTTMHIMRWSAASENWHRIHYDHPFATGHDGLPDVVVNGSWKQHVLVQLLKDWAGPDGWLWKIEFQFRDKDLPGDTITARGQVTRTEVRGDHGYVECAIQLENQRGIRSTTGEALVVLPLRAGTPLPWPFVPEAQEAQEAAPPAPAASVPQAQYLTDAVRAVVGVQSEEQVACDPVERGSIRRITQAIMDDDPLFRDEAHARATRYGSLVAPPLFPVHMIQRGPGTPDPLARAWSEPDYDGSRGAAGLFALPGVPIPLKRVLNAGVEVEFFQYALPGDRVTVVNRYADIFEKQGKKGPMVFVVVERRFRKGQGEPLLTLRQTLVYS